MDCSKSSAVAMEQQADSGGNKDDNHEDDN